MNNLLTNDPFALRLLLNDELYLADDTPPPAAPVAEIPRTPEDPASPGFHYMGENNRFILMIVEDPRHEFADKDTLGSINRLLAGLHLSMADVALVNFSGFKEVKFAALRDFFGCSKVVLFGVGPERLGLPVMAPNESSKAEGVKILATYSFGEMNADEQKKRQFWTAIKLF